MINRAQPGKLPDNSVKSRSEPLPWDNSSREPPDYDGIISWLPVESDSNTEESLKISDSMARVIKEAFSKTLFAEKKKFPHPDSVHTKWILPSNQNCPSKLRMQMRT